LKDAIAISRSNQRLILDGDKVDVAPCGDGAEGRLVVSQRRTFEAASAYARTMKTCVLNFASASNPGGGVVNGSSAQEEALCRCSTLYFNLNTNEMWNGFYSPHRAARDPIHNDDAIYTPRVVVFKSDTAFPKLLPEPEWYEVDVISCAAPNLRERPSNIMNSGDGDRRVEISPDQLRALHERRLRRILDIAAANGEEAVILGAFGCGAFRNDPVVVSAAAVAVVPHYRNRFKAIEFAVYCRPGDTHNYDAFKRTLST
jgi:uncharacterized protein (TIGR02452 family)